MAKITVESVQCFDQKKTAEAITHCKRSRRLIKINDIPIELIKSEILRTKAYEPVLLLGRYRFFGIDMRICVRGGGHTSQIYAICQSIAKALVAYFQKYVDKQAKKEIKDILVRYDRTLSSLLISSNASPRSLVVVVVALVCRSLTVKNNFYVQVIMEAPP